MLKSKEKLNVIKSTLKSCENNITDDYMCGYCNALEFCLSVFENREPNYFTFDDSYKEHEEQNKEKAISGFVGVRKVGS